MTEREQWIGFLPHRQTVFQTMTTEYLQDWHLAYRDDGTDPAYFIELLPTEAALIEVICHLAEKAWVSREDMIRGLLPALEAVRDLRAVGGMT